MAGASTEALSRLRKGAIFRPDPTPNRRLKAPKGGHFQAQLALDRLREGLQQAAPENPCLLHIYAITIEKSAGRFLAHFCRHVKLHCTISMPMSYPSGKNGDFAGGSSYTFKALIREPFSIEYEKRYTI